MELLDKRQIVRAATRAKKGEAHQRLAPGEMLGDYSVRRRIYLDSLVSYYVIRDHEAGQEIPIGIFHPIVAEDIEFPERLERLIQALSVTEELAICLIRKYEVIDGLHCVLFEPAHGRSLEGKVDEARILTKSGVGPKATIHVVRQLLAGLHDAHAHQIYHRSLDPCLIFQADDDTIQVLGFGLYDVLGKVLIDQIHASNSVLSSSTSAEESPELKVYKERLRRLSDDVYGTANLTYQLLQGHSPKYIDGELSRLDLENLPSKWRSFFKKTLILNGDKRLNSIFEIDRRLDRILDEKPAGVWERVRNFFSHLPAPRWIRKRGVLASRFYWTYRVLTIVAAGGLLGIPLLEPVAFDYVEKRQPVAIQRAATESFDVALNFVQTGATVELIDHDTRFVVTGRQLLLDLRSGSYRVKVSAPEYLPEYQEFAVERGSFEANAEPIDLNFDLLPLEQGIYVESVADARVYGQSESGATVELGITDSFGRYMLMKDLMQGVESLTVEKSGFNPKTIHSSSIRIGRSPTIGMDLLPIAAVLSVNSDPVGASIFLNDEFVGTTPTTIGELDPNIDYTVRLELAGFHDINRQVDLGPDELFELSVGAMSRLNSGVLVVEPRFESAPAGLQDAMSRSLQFKIAGAETEPGELRLSNVPEGNHILRVEHPLFEPTSSRVVIRDGAVLNAEVALHPKPGSVILQYDEKYPVNYEVNGVPITATNGVIEVPAYEPVRIGLEIRDHFTMQREFTVGPTESAVWYVEPVRLPSPASDESWSVPYLGMRFSWVPAGRQLIGSPPLESGRLPNEANQYAISARQGYWIGMTEVTQSEYLSLMGTNPSDFIGSRHPVENVSWFDAMKYCVRLNEIETKAGRMPDGYAYQLPTEIEWEFAVRGGTQTPFVFGETATPTNANFRGYYPGTYRPDVPVKAELNTVKVGSYRANAIGLFDVHGNVHEWTRDGFKSRRGDELAVPVNIEDETALATIRGGSWQTLAMRCRTASRKGVLISEKSNSVGFRVVLSPVQSNFE